jgi:hypothetical protein
MKSDVASPVHDSTCIHTDRIHQDRTLRWEILNLVAHLCWQIKMGGGGSVEYSNTQLIQNASTTREIKRPTWTKNCYGSDYLLLSCCVLCCGEIKKNKKQVSPTNHTLTGRIYDWAVWQCLGKIPKKLS